MRVPRTRDPKFFNYTLTGQVLEEVMDAIAVVVTLGNDLEWSKHIATMTNKANSCTDISISMISSHQLFNSN